MSILDEANKTAPDRGNRFELELDPGIKNFVLLLLDAGIETLASCQGGPDHAYPEPTIRFHGDRSEGFKALAVAIQHALPVSCLRRVWDIDFGEPTGPCWELVFWKTHGERVKGNE